MSCSKYTPLSFENQFADLYYEAFKTMFDLKNPQLLQDVRVALNDIRKLKFKIREAEPEERPFFNNDKFKNISYRFAYLYAYGVLHSVIVSNHFSKHLQNNLNEISQHLSERKLNLCCLGGGCGLEAIAVCKVIENFLKSKGGNESWILDVYITVIDICQEWEQNLHLIVETVKKRSSFFPSKRIKLHAKFIQADLLKPFTDDVERTIREANVVTMIKLASSIERNSEQIDEILRNMLKYVIKCISKESCFLLLDNSGGSDFHLSVRNLFKCSYLYKIATKFHEAYYLDVKVLQKMGKLMEPKNKKPLLCLPTRITKVSSCFWVKKAEEEKKVKAKKVKSISSKTLGIFSTAEDVKVLQSPFDTVKNYLSNNELEEEKKDKERAKFSGCKVTESGTTSSKKHQSSDNEKKKLSKNELKEKKLSKNELKDKKKDKERTKILGCKVTESGTTSSKKDQNSNNESKELPKNELKEIKKEKKRMKFLGYKVTESGATSSVDARHFPIPWEVTA